jgi:hypothetical protein
VVQLCDEGATCKRDYLSNLFDVLPQTNVLDSIRACFLLLNSRKRLERLERLFLHVFDVLALPVESFQASYVLKVLPAHVQRRELIMGT